MRQFTLKATDPEKVIPMLQDMIQGETQRLKHSLMRSKKRLDQYESKYNISSDLFMTEWAAEDLPGGDLEYIEWAGEFELATRLQERIAVLESIENVSP